MLADLRAACVTVAETVSDHVWSTLPDDVSELPCVVIGLPELGPESEVVFDASCDVYVIGGRNGAGHEDELITLTDVVLAAFGGSRGHKSSTVGVLAVDTVRPTRLNIAGTEFPAYTLSVATSLTTC